MGKYWLEQRRIARRRREADILVRRLTERTRAGRWGAALDAAAMLEQLQPRDGRWPRATAELRRRMGHLFAAAEAYERAVDRHVEAGEVSHALSAAKLLLLLDPTRSAVLARIGGRDASDLARVYGLQEVCRVAPTRQAGFPPEPGTRLHPSIGRRLRPSVMG